MLENINLAFQGVWSHKLRSFLTMLGIIIGIAAIITIVSTIQGTNEQIKQNLIGAGNNVVRVTIGATDSQNYFDLNYSALPEGIDPVTREMRDEMEKLGSVSLVSMYYSRDWCDNVYVGNTAFSGSLYGVDDHYLTAVDYAVNYGRSFTAADYENRRNVALIDAKSAKSLFQGENPIGGTIEINGMPFTVVGVVSSRSSSLPHRTHFGGKSRSRRRYSALIAPSPAVAASGRCTGGSGAGFPSWSGGCPPCPPPQGAFSPGLWPYRGPCGSVGWAHRTRPPKPPPGTRCPDSCALS